MAGRSDEIKGGIKQGLGKLSGDDALETEGAAQKETGRAKRKAGGAMREAGGNLKTAAGDLLDSPTLGRKAKSTEFGAKPNAPESLGSLKLAPGDSYSGPHPRGGLSPCRPYLPGVCW
jgi:uncharacterized protein YjbJ (UPF0337 family)